MMHYASVVTKASGNRDINYFIVYTFIFYLQSTLSKPSFNLQVSGMPITVGVGNIISEEGFSLMMSPAAAGSVWKSILSLGALPMGSNAWEKLRVLQGGDS
jgi:hypothetical protein